MDISILHPTTEAISHTQRPASSRTSIAYRLHVAAGEPCQHPFSASLAYFVDERSLRHEVSWNVCSCAMIWQISLAFAREPRLATRITKTGAIGRDKTWHQLDGEHAVRDTVCLVRQ